MARPFTSRDARRLIEQYKEIKIDSDYIMMLVVKYHKEAIYAGNY